MITLTVTKRNGQTQGTLSRGFAAQHIRNLRPTTEGNLSSVARFEFGEDTDSLETYDVSQTYTQVLDAITADQLEAGAEVVTNKVTSISGASTDTEYPSAKLLYDQLALKAPLASPTFTGNPIAPTQAVANNSTRIATTAFVQGEFTAKIAKIASGALVAGVRTINDAAIAAGSIVVVQRIAPGGTVSAGGYKVTINAGVSAVITALQADGTTTENANTDTVMGLIYY